MDGQDDAQAGAVPFPRRPRAVPGPPGDGPSRVPDLASLLQDIDALRTTLQTDLSLAAAALEAGADAVAGELVDGDLAEVRRFASRAADRLDALALQEAEPEADAEPAVEVVALAPRRRRRLLPAAPLVAAAAAVLGFVAGVVPEQQPVTTPETRMTSAAMASWQLSRLADAGAPPEELRAAAEQLNDELAALIARAADDPAAAQQALLLLATTEDVLSRQSAGGVLAGVLAEAQQLRARLREALPVVTARRPVVRPPAADPVPLLPERRDSQPAAEQQPATAQPAPSSAPSPAPAQPAQPDPQPQPTPEPAGSPQPEDPEGGGGPLVPDGSDSLPGGG